MTVHPLRAALNSLGGKLNRVTVEARQNDPFRVDTPAGHRNGAWLAMHAGSRRLHLRGLHYLLIGKPRPDTGEPYANTEKDWNWLVAYPGKAARWLGYLSWDQVPDRRNDEPLIHEYSKPDRQPKVTAGTKMGLPSVEDLLPAASADFSPEQPFHLVLFGEKASLESELLPLAVQYQADLYLPAGEISDNLLYRMAKAAVADGRPMVVLTFSDADPSGWQMPISIARKMQAFKILMPGMPDFKVYRALLTPRQVRAENASDEPALPSSPLKEGEKRAAAWRAAMGIEQTEVDSLMALRPGRLQEIAEDAIRSFYDPDLDDRAAEAERDWQQRADAALNAHLGEGELDRLRTVAGDALAEIGAKIDDLNRDLDLPPAEVPEPAVSGKHGLPLLDSRWPFRVQTRQLIESRGYLDLDEERDRWIRGDSA